MNDYERYVHLFYGLPDLAGRPIQWPVQYANPPRTARGTLAMMNAEIDRQLFGVGVIKTTWRSKMRKIGRKKQAAAAPEKVVAVFESKTTTSHKARVGTMSVSWTEGGKEAEFYTGSVYGTANLDADEIDALIAALARARGSIAGGGKP